MTTLNVETNGAKPPLRRSTGLHFEAPAGTSLHPKLFFLPNFATDGCPPPIEPINTTKNPKMCMCCSDALEDQAHVFQCPFQDSWQSTFIANLYNHLLKDDTDPVIQNAILEGIDAWITRRQRLPGWDPQASIGWEQFLYGFVSYEWGQRQARFKKDPAIAYTWTMRLIQFLWHQSKAGWLARNERVHDKESAIAAQHYRNQLEEKVRRLYSFYDSLSARDKDLLAVPLETRLRQTDRQLQFWLDKNSELIHHCIKAHKAARNHSIRSYFSTFFQRSPR